MLMTKCSGVPLDVKALADNGEFEGYLSVFGNVDSYGEMVMPGAFSGSLVDGGAQGPLGQAAVAARQRPPDRRVEGPRRGQEGPLRQGPAADRRQRPGEGSARPAQGRRGRRAVDRLPRDRGAPHPDKNGVLQLKKLDLMEGEHRHLPRERAGQGRQRQASFWPPAKCRRSASSRSSCGRQASPRPWPRRSRPRQRRTSGGIPATERRQTSSNGCGRAGIRLTFGAAMVRRGSSKRNQ
jgi:hypothetical protein